MTQPIRAQAIRDAHFDLVIAAGPRVGHFPSIGARTLSLHCSKFGLTVGFFGGDHLSVRGIIPFQDTGCVVIAEDVQKRIHRIQTRALVRFSAQAFQPDPFPGWQSHGLIPLSTARKLFHTASVQWLPCTVLLGTGNAALRFGSQLIEQFDTQVFCVESSCSWGAKRIAGWEVDRRRFEMAGGKIIEAKPVDLVQKSPLLWTLRLEDSHGIRVLEVGRVISAGPFQASAGVRQYPPNSLLFEIDQIAPENKSDDQEAWAREEAQARLLSHRIAKTLIPNLGPFREELETLQKKAKTRLRLLSDHFENPHVPSHQGKWLDSRDLKKVKTFPGVPQKLHLKIPIAAIECLENIACDLCQKSCPTQAIGRTPSSITLKEADCTACGQCLVACPSQSISIFRIQESDSLSSITLPWSRKLNWKVGEFATLLNRKGESLGTGRISKITPVEVAFPGAVQALIELKVPTHLIWEARAIRKPKPGATAPDPLLEADSARQLGLAKAQEKVEITFNGERRLVHDKVPISLALFEIGRARQEDTPYCQDGSCGRCEISVDGINKLACTTPIHKGMTIRSTPIALEPPSLTPDLCPCLKVHRDEIIRRIQHGKLRSPEAVISVTQVTTGTCQGQLCCEAFKRLLKNENFEEHFDMDQWIHWGLPWRDWTLHHN